MWDVFISHATEDKGEIAAPLAEALSTAGLKVWYDDFTLTLGDSLNRSINQGLAQARYGIVILSPAFLAKEWPQRELDGLTTREVSGGKVILPVWHKLERSEVERYSPILADKLGISTGQGLDAVVEEVLRAVRLKGTPLIAKHHHRSFNRRTLIRVAGALLLLIGALSAYFYRLEQQPLEARAQLAAVPLAYTPAAFGKSAEEGDLRAVELFLEAGIYPDVEAPGNEYGDPATALMRAAGAGHVAIVEALLNSGADVNKWLRGTAPLLWAAAGGHNDIVKLLIERGADQTSIDAALYSATVRGHLDTVDLLFAKGAKMTAESGGHLLSTAANRGHTALVAFYLDRGVDINVQDDGGMTALMDAAHNDQLETTQLLLDRGANVNLRDHEGETPLSRAIGYPRISDLLIERGADVNAVNHKSVSILTKAIGQIDFQGGSERLEQLLRRGAHVNQADSEGETPLLHALELLPRANSAATLGMIHRLLAHGADVNASNHNGDTPLLRALAMPVSSENGSPSPTPELVRILLEKGARVDSRVRALAAKLPPPLRQPIMAVLSGKQDHATSISKTGAKAP